MVPEAQELLDRLAAGLSRARARRDASHEASLQLLERIATAVEATRHYVERGSRLHDGSLEMARWSSVSDKWLAAARDVLAADLPRAEKKLAAAEGWTARRPWKRIEKEDGGWRLQTVLEHCEALLDGLPQDT